MAFSTHDQVPDSPTNTFATLNSITSSSGTYSDGNLRIAADDTDVHLSTIACPIGLISYFETIPVSTSNREIVGFSTGDSAYVIYYYNWQDNDTRIIWESVNGTGSYISGHLNNDITGKLIGLSLDLSGTYINLKMYVDGTLLVNQTTNTLVSSITKPIFPLVQSATGAFTFYTNFGQDPTFGGAKSPSTTYTDANGIGAFYYQPPTDALALCTANLPDFTPTVTDDVPQDYFKAVTYTGQTADSTFINNGNNNWSKTGVGFSPDFVWIKKRTGSGAGNNSLFDTIRGATNGLHSDNVDQQFSDSTTLTSFDSNGFSVGTHAVVNDSSGTYVSWCWKAGGAPTADNTATSDAMNANGSAATSSNSSVSINGVLQSNYTPAGSPTIYPKRMSINTNAGFSIVKWQASNGSDKTIPHGLSNSLDMIVMKNLDAGTYSWHVSHVGLTTNHNVLLNDTGESFNAATGGWVEIGTGGVFNIKNGTIGTNTNKGTDNYIAYCWHSVAGYSKFGSYTGNGSEDGPFAYCGFRPAFVMCKCTSDTTTTHTSWAMYDNARDSRNVMNKVLYANKSINEGYRGDASTAATDIYIDFLSNGFKVRSTKEEINDDGETYIFMAFAEQPFKFSNAR